MAIVQQEVFEVRTYPGMRWGAIIGGWLVATGIAALLYVAGLALGFTPMEHSGASVRALGIGTGIWIVLTWTVSLFLGGLFASWFDGRADQAVGALHGITVWGLSVATTGFLVAMGLTETVSAGADLVGRVADTAATAAATVDRATGPAVREISTAAMWVMFASLALSLAASGLGGWLGAGHIDRVRDSALRTSGL